MVGRLGPKAEEPAVFLLITKAAFFMSSALVYLYLTVKQGNLYVQPFSR